MTCTPGGLTWGRSGISQRASATTKAKWACRSRLTVWVLVRCILSRKVALLIFGQLRAFVSQRLVFGQKVLIDFRPPRLGCILIRYPLVAGSLRRDCW